MIKINSMLQRIMETRCIKCPFGKELCFGAYTSPHCIANRYIHLLIQVKNIKTKRCGVMKWNTTLL